MMDDSYGSIGSLGTNTSFKDGDLSFLADFERLRVSALSKAAEISPLVKEVTIGPNSPIKKEYYHKEITVDKENKKEDNFIEKLARDDLRHTLLMKKYEKRLHETSEELFKDLVENMIAKHADSMEKYWKKQSEESERKSKELRARKLQMFKEMQENDNVSVLESARLDQQKIQMINKQTIENMNRILEEKNKATARFAAITDSHTRICICYNDITNIMQSEPDSKTVCEKYITSIKVVIDNINKIMDVCKLGVISDQDVQQAELLAQDIDNIKMKILDDLNSINEQKNLKKQKDEEAILKEIEAKKKVEEQAKAAKLAQAKSAAAEQKIKTAPMFYSQKNYRYYEDLRKFLDTYEAQYKDLLDNVNLKKFRFDCQKAVNTPVNAISSVSGHHMKDKYEKLSKLLKGERVQVLDIYVQATQHPQGLQYCTALLAKKIVRQGELLVSSNPEAAFPIAAVTVALWCHFPDFGKLVEAYFHRHCPYLVPMFLPQKEGQTDKEFYISRGYTYNSEGEVEKQDKFLKRMSGIFRLMCAIWIAKTPKFINVVNPHGISCGWKWVASFINLKPEPDISATLLFDFFTVCGSDFLKTYNKQFIKIIRLISMQYLYVLQNIDEGGPKTRLEVFLQNVLKTGVIEQPKGLISAQTW